MRRTSTDEVAVSDVLGSVLLVGITVLMAAAFGAVLLAYEGPSDVQHSQLSIRVGPGADDDWGTNDAELVIRHIGGEPLDEDDVTVFYTDTAGDHTVTPSFTNGKLRLGDEWVQVISAGAGDEVEVTVTVVEEGGAAILSSGSVSAGGTGAELTYVNAITPASAAKGTVDVGTLIGAQSAGDSNAAAILRAGATGGSPTVTTLSGTVATAIGGASNQDNAKVSDSSRALLDNGGEGVSVGTFTGVPAQYAVSALSIGMQARGVQPAVTHVATLTGSSSSSNVVSSAIIPVVSGEIYIASIANGVSNLRAVSTLTGPCLTTSSCSSGVTWQLLETQTNSAGNGKLEVWIGKGTPTIIGGFVTATFAGGATDRAAISVSRYSNADLTGANPIDAVQAFLAGENAVAGGSTAVNTLAAIAGTANGLFYAAINGVISNGGTGCTFTSPTNERADFDPGSNRVQLCNAGGTATAGTTNTLSATLAACSGGGCVLDWQAIVLTIKPVPLPSVTLSYSGCSGCSGSTTQLHALTSTSDLQYTTSIIGDKTTWALSDLAGLTVTATYTTDVGTDVEINHLYLSLTYTTTPTTYDTQADLTFLSVPDADNHIFQMRYKISGDTFRVYAMTGLVERICPGNLASGLYAVFTCTLSTAEYNAGAPTLRIKDPAGGGTTQGILTIEYARVSSS